MTEGHKSLKGQLLLDNGNLRGSFFQRTVVLICQHDEDGAFGLILNRDTNTTVGEAIVADLPSHLKNTRLYLGGPVQPQALSYLHSSPTLLDANVISGLSLGHSLDSLIELSESFSPNDQVRIFAGYAGWSPGQLDEEMERESWMAHPASIELVFNEKPKELWRKILLEKGDVRYRILASSPEDLSWN
jgi:putative transcriptional regulator